MLPNWLTEPARHFAGRHPVTALGDRFDDATRKRFDAAMTVAGERLDAADVLGRPPHRAESIHVLVRALRSLEEAVACAEQVAPHGQGSPGFAPDALRRTLQDARNGLGAAAAADAELSRADLFGRADARRVARHVHSYLRQVARKRRSVVGRRWAAALVVVAAILAARLGIPRLQDRFTVVASGIYSSVFEADHAVDGDPASEWLAPDGLGGWLEIRFARPIDVAAVRVTNAHNPGFNDRATRDLDVELYRKNELVANTRSVFDRIDPGATPRTIEVKADGITRVRLVARTFHGRGAGLAEVEVVEAK